MTEFNGFTSGATGSGFTLIVALDVDEQPAEFPVVVSVAVTVYVTVFTGETVMIAPGKLPGVHT